MFPILVNLCFLPFFLRVRPENTTISSHLQLFTVISFSRSDCGCLVTDAPDKGPRHHASFS